MQDPARLSALAQSGLPPGAFPEGTIPFDRLSALVAKVLRVPLALVSLVEEGRQAFQGLYGPLPEPFLSQRETPLSHSFCQHVAATNEPLIVRNAREDERVRENLAVRDLNVMAYLGVPLTTADGHAIGSLCAIDTAPRQWTDDDLETLRGLAGFAIAELELRRNAPKVAALAARDHPSSHRLGRQDNVHLLVHDLRTPLNSLLLGLQTLPMLGELNEEQREALELANRGGQALVALVDDMLDLSSADAAGSGAVADLAVEEIFPEQLLRAAYQQVEALARDHGIILLVEPPADQPPQPLLADRDKLARALVNLLANAIKFTPAKGVVSASARRSEDGQWVAFIVRDTGRGIAREDFGRIFERFVWIGGDQQGRGGRSSGLGLAFCQMVAAAHGGGIDVQSELGVGSVFTLRLPCAPGAAGRSLTD